MAVKHKRQLTDDERAERRAQDREYARHAVEQLRSSDGWNAWLTARASFRNYSLGNQLQIAMARPTATRVAGFRAWLKLGYSVQKRPDDVPEGAWAIKIWAPCPPSRKQLERWQQNGSEPRRAATNVLQARPGLRQVISCSGRGMSSMSGREIRYRSVSRLLLLVRAPGPAGGDGLSLRGRRGAGAGGRRRGGDRARVWRPGDPSAKQRRDEPERRECRHRVPHAGISRTEGRPARRLPSSTRWSQAPRLERSWLVLSDSGSPSSGLRRRKRWPVTYGGAARPGPTPEERSDRLEFPAPTIQGLRKALHDKATQAHAGADPQATRDADRRDDLARRGAADGAALKPPSPIA